MTTTNASATNGATKPAFVKGLDGVVAAQTEISLVDGPNSTLVYRGINIHELAEQASYEEVAFLLLHGHLPNRSELADFNARLVANRWLPAPMYDLLRQLPPDAVPMEALRTAISALSFYDPEIEDISIEATLRKAVRLIAQVPTLTAAFERIRKGKEPIPPNPRLSHAANTLHMFGLSTEPEFVQALNVYYILLADHGMNASTFTARVVASTQADLHSAISAAYASLKGPLHGGANEATMRMLLEIGDVDKVDEYVDKAFAAKRKIMGFGHRIYKHGDPRSLHLNRWSEHLGRKVNQLKYYEMSLAVERAVLRHRELYPNVDFFSATLLYYLGIPIDMFTPMFACARIAGWCAHVIEQYKDNVLIRPQSEYIGPTGLHYIPIEQR
ncbi:MAG: citrate synthase [Thermoflexales bacterium]|nr:citrate synthase [Thermoflexales bacterium]MDW8053009.1 citrate/2-methylcitrate synthase [Anaerolineae bacterium]MDW8291662.1 citrate/2-methylcitrate synthase [Anaerolineae bacterium]